MRSATTRKRIPFAGAATLALSSGLLIAGLLFGAAPAAALDGPERCPRLMAGAEPPLLHRAGLRRSGLHRVQAEEGAVRLTYVGHATFLIESPGGVTIATDYNDFVRPAVTPQVATMNRAHSTHYSTRPEAGIVHLLPGWGEDGAPARHELTIGDVWLRNVTTNIRTGYGDTLYDANSIFVFEVSGLCIAHLGHLHHALSPDHLRALGRIDVVLAPVDGGYTANIDEMVETLRAIQAPVVVPMHYFGQATLDRFLGRLGGHYEVVRHSGAGVTLSRATLPPLPTVLVLRPGA